MVVYHGKCEKPYQFTLRFGEAVNLQTGEHRKMTTFADGPVHAVAGIGHPRRFFTQLRELGLTVYEHAFADHHVYEAGDVEFGDNAPVLVTEKDAVKLRRFCAPAEPRGRPGNIWVVPVTAEMSGRLGGDLINLLGQGG